MRDPKRGIFLAVALLACGVATAQTAPDAADTTVDLPVEKPEPKKPQPPKPPEPDPPIEQGDDKPPTIYGREIKSENDTVFYVIDISGSMQWDYAQYTTPDGQVTSGVRMDRAKAALVTSVLSLPQNFKFNVLAYDCTIRQWQAQMMPADDPTKASARGWIMGLIPAGGTATGPAVAAALQLKDNKVVVLLTDGEPNCGAGPVNPDGSVSSANLGPVCDAHRSMIRSNNTQGAVVNVFGIGAVGLFQTFCQQVAGDNGGTYNDVR
jgi:hypothetical protein